MSYTPYYAPYSRPMGYYNPSIPQENQNIQVGQQFNPQMQQPIQQMMQTPTPMMSNDMLWVLNETEATSYPVAPNNRVILWDKNQDTVYIKSVDAQGVPSIQILDYVERTPQKLTETHKCTCGDRFIPKEKFDELEAKFDELRAKVENLEKPKIMPKNKKAEENNDGE